MEKIKRLLFVILGVLASSISASAYDFEVDGIYYNLLSVEDETCEVAYNKNNYSGDVVIPSFVRYNGIELSVISIGENAFYNSRQLTSVVIPSSVTRIGRNAFAACEGLTSMVIPESVTQIGSSAFQYCRSLVSIEIPRSVTSIGDMAFMECSDLTAIVVPNSVKVIHSSAFSLCKGLESIVIGNSVEYIGEQVFNGCTNLHTITSLAVIPPLLYSYFEYDTRITGVLKVPMEAVDAYRMANGWKAMKNIVGLQKCLAPSIEIIDGKMSVTTETEGAVCNTEITSEDIKSYVGNGEIELSGVYKITSYATAEGYDDSETVTAYLYWSKPSLDAEAEMTLVGDLNNDGEVDIVDVVTLVDIILNK